MIIKYRFSEMKNYCHLSKFKCKSTVVAFKGMILFKQELLVHIAKEPRENMMSYHIIKTELISKKIKLVFFNKNYFLITKNKKN